MEARPRRPGRDRPGHVRGRGVATATRSGNGRATALVLEGPRRLARRELALPDIGPDDALLRVEACGLCGTDHEQYAGTLPARFAFIPGHESVGTLERVGAAAADRWGVVEGDRVAVEVFQSCGACAPCTSGQYRRCARHGLADMYGFIDVDKPPGLWGGYATHQYLGPDSLVLKVPDNLEAQVATLFNPLGAGIRWGVTVPGTTAGDVVAVLGPGIRGLSVVAAVRDAGAGFVMVTGHGQGDQERLGWCARFGADLTVDVTTADPVAELRAATGGLADVVVDVTANAPAALGQCVALARPGGTVVLAGVRGSAETPGFWPDLVVYKELRMLGALGVDAPAYRDALSMLATGERPWVDLPRRVVGMEDVEELILDMSGESGRPRPLHGVLEPWR